MKVVHLSAEKTWRGGEQQLAYLVKGSLEKGEEAFVICKEGSAFEAFCRDSSIRFYSLPFNSQYDVITAWEIRRICRKENPDLMHLHSSHSHAVGVLAHLLGSRIPLVLSRKVDFKVNSNPLSHFKYNYSGIRKIICVSEEVRRVLAPSLRDPSRCVVVHDGIDLSRFSTGFGENTLKKEFGIPEDTLLVGNTSAIADHKDYFTFLRAAVLLRQRIKAKFLIIGDGPLRDAVAKEVLNLGLEEDVILTGFRKDVPVILPMLDVFLMTSKTEGLGSSVLDAWACRVPVVATAAGGIPEMVKHNHTGLLAPVFDAEELARLVQQVTEDVILRSRLVNTAYEKVKSFTKEVMIASTLEVYRSLLES
jgi:L-malate glycosyltransferase